MTTFSQAQRVVAMGSRTVDLLQEIRDILAGGTKRAAALEDGDGARLGFPSVGVVGDDQADAGTDEEPVVTVEVVGDLLPAVHGLSEAFAQGRDVLVITEPDLVVAIQKLLEHDSSRSSVAPTSSSASAASTSSSQEASPEGSDVEGSASADSSTSRAERMAEINDELLVHATISRLVDLGVFGPRLLAEYRRLEKEDLVETIERGLGGIKVKASVSKATAAKLRRS